MESQINSKIKYNKRDDVYDEDVDQYSYIYEMTIKEYNLKVKIAIGKQKFIHANKGVLFFPIYLVNEDEIVAPIGVYEIKNMDFPEMFNEDEYLNLEKLEKLKPLLYPHIDEDFLSVYSEKIILQEEEKDEDPETKSSLEESEGYREKEENEKTDTPDSVDDTEQAEKERGSYVEKLNTLWIEKFMHNNNYDIIDNEGGGDCLFAVIRDALKDVGIIKSVDTLRTQLSGEATQELFNEYRTLYTDNIAAVKQSKTVLKNMKSEIAILKDKYKKSTDRSLKKNIEQQIKKIASNYSKLNDELKITIEIAKEFEEMKKIKSLKEFKEHIMTCEFWGNTWAITTLEQILNIKIILLSSEAYESDDKDNVVFCGSLNDENLGDNFSPDHYIIADFSGIHYKLITYKDKKAFKYNELPYDLKKLILIKCMEGQHGPYHIINDFKKAKKDYLKDKDISETKTEEVPQFEDSKLFDNSIIFQVYGKSNDKPMPGKGVGEKISNDQLKDYAQLSKEINWRRKLSYEWPSPIKLDDYTWKSVLHYINANKFKSNSEIYKQFAIESETKLSDDVNDAKNAGLKPQSFFKKGVSIDKDYSTNADKYLKKANFAKFTQHKDLRKILIETKDAKILQYVRGNEPITMNVLMQLRKDIQNDPEYN
jgi:predicted NAD-dependent protein-ADP-ribosyltransferase YbiA (DUF1768 family)